MNTQTTTGRKYTLPEIKAANKAIGHHFFSKGAKSFFNSQYLPTVYQGAGGIYFITAERMDERFELKYTVRQFHAETGQVDTAGSFNTLTKEQARSKAKYYALVGCAE